MKKKSPPLMLGSLQGAIFLFYYLGGTGHAMALKNQAREKFNPDEVNQWATPPKKIETIHHIQKSDIKNLESGCMERHEGGDCRSLGYALMAFGENFQARKSWEKGCELDDVSSCFNLGLSHYRQRHPRSAEIPWEKACDQHHPKACYFLGRLAQEEKRFYPMQNFWQKACDLNMGRACADLAKFMREKKGELMYARELDYYACKEGLSDSCPDRLTHHRDTKRNLRDVKTDSRERSFESFPSHPKILVTPELSPDFADLLPLK